jgi:hypothetical protein
MTSFCDLYSTGSGQTWPIRMFPSTSFPRGSAARSRDAVKAWNFFEQVEAYDAAMRVKYSSIGGFTPSSAPIVTQAPWYIFKGEAERLLYKRGRSLHIQLCPDQNWTPQRSLGVPTTEVMNVFPGDCHEEVGGTEEGPRSMPMLERSDPSPALSGKSGSLQEVSTLGDSSRNSTTTGDSSRNSVASGQASADNSTPGSRRDSISHV